MEQSLGTFDKFTCDFEITHAIFHINVPIYLTDATKA